MCNTHLYLHLLHDLYILKNICLHIQTSKSNPTWQRSFSLLCKSIFWHQGTWLPTPWYTCSSDQIPSVRPTSHLWHPLGLTGASALPSCSGCDTSLCLRVGGWEGSWFFHSAQRETEPASGAGRGGQALSFCHRGWVLSRGRGPPWCLQFALVTSAFLPLSDGTQWKAWNRKLKNRKAVIFVVVDVQSPSCVCLFAAPRTAAHRWETHRET